ncbi:hypothetical protein [Salinibacter ruber]|uniref:hypothetical protein n=1 Tax=Salinibacter ruber TaxID=146919 RepID=UPI0021683387|nr:hypothetical protein [Salinibacter ruber]MCS4149275.1 hypothetical protein [Salinibacter ruber]
MPSKKNTKWNDIETSCKDPGIYAWYLINSIGSADRDVPDGWSRLVEKYISDHERPGMGVNAKATLGLEFNGEINHVTIDEDKGKSWSPNTESIDIVTDLLNLSVPNLAAPLYIGVAPNGIRGRLMDHKRDIKRYRREGIEKIANIRDRDPEREEDRIFASRVVSRNIDVNKLWIEYITIGRESYEGDLEEGLKTAEFILNRIFFPILGKK